MYFNWLKIKCKLDMTFVRHHARTRNTPTPIKDNLSIALHVETLVNFCCYNVVRDFELN